MRDFIDSAFDALENCTDEVRDCLRDIIIRGFAYCKITSGFRKAVAASYGVPLGQVEEMNQAEVINLGFLTLDEPGMTEAFRFHAELVDEVWNLLLQGEAAA